MKSGRNKTQQPTTGGRPSPLQRRRPSKRRQPGESNMLRQYQLRVNPANDAYEHEADRVAQQVSQMTEGEAQHAAVGQENDLASQITPLIQRQMADQEEEETVQAKAIQRQEAVEEEEEAVQAKAIQRQEASEEEEEAVQAKVIQRQEMAEEEEEAVQTKRVQRQEVTEEEEEAVQAKTIQRQEMAEEEEAVQAKTIQRQEAAEEEEEAIQAKQARMGEGGSVTPEMEERINQLMQSGGRPLSTETREYFEPRFRADFSQIRIHDDAEAARIAAQMNARAFTQGQHIFFGAGQYQPHDRAGRELLSHELTHTIQQGTASANTMPKGIVQRNVIQRTNGSSTPSGTPAASPPSGSPYNFTNSRITLGPLPLRPFKATGRGAQLYTSRSGRLYRNKEYNRDDNVGQKRIWLDRAETTNVENKLTSNPYNMDASKRYYLKPRRGMRSSEVRFGTPAEIAANLQMPEWNQQGQKMRHHVDHVVELAVGGWPSNSAWLNSMNNFQLLDGRSNSSSVAVINNWLHGWRNRPGELQRFYNSPTGTQFRQQLPSRLQNAAYSGAKQYIMTHYDIYFSGFQSSGSNLANLSLWEPNQIRDGEHLTALLTPSKNQRVYDIYDLSDNRNSQGVFTAYNADEQERLFGSSERIVAYYNSFGGNSGFFRWGDRHGRPNGTRVQGGAIQPRDHSALNIQLEYMEFDPSATGNRLGEIKGKPFSWRGRGKRFGSSDVTATILRVPGTQFAGYIDPTALNQITASLGFASPIEIRSVIFGADGIEARGKLLPTIPLMRQADIDVVMNADEFRFEKVFRIGEFNVPRPFQIQDSSLILSLGTQSGLGITGRIDFGIDRVGQGYLEGRAQTGRGSRPPSFALGGGFDFDTQLFEPANIRMSYENNQFSASGTLGIPSGRIRGIRSAQFTIGYENETLTATGTAQFAAPGIQQGSLNLTYSEAQGLIIGGSVQLGQVPGLSGGSLEAQVQRKPDGNYKVSASGTAQPNIPGINSQIRLSYDDGIFDANVTASYQRGLLSGELTVGATNRPVDEDSNRPTGDPGNEVRAYGGGQVTVQIAPWLQGTVGIRLLPNGEIELTGEIGLPSAVEIFPRKAIEKNIFTLNIDIPIVGVAVAGQRIGIFATVGGGLDASAGIGPGQIQELRLGVQYNPDREEETHVYGRGRLHIPADAGLRLFVRGGLGVGIPIVSATAGLEVSGQLGIEGAIGADVNIDWRPRTGLEITANANIFAEPTLRLSVDAYVEVTADLLLTEIDLYSNRWNLAGVEYGSGLRFGINFPIHYKEGQPFDISLDDVQFTVPNIDARSVIRNVLQQA